MKVRAEQKPSEEETTTVRPSADLSIVSLELMKELSGTYHAKSVNGA